MELALVRRWPLRVLVTACTNAAIENVLERLCFLIRVWRSLRSGAAAWRAGSAEVCVKLEREVGPGDPATPYGRCASTSWSARRMDAAPVLVLGGTIHQLHKICGKLDGRFDLLVVDEASQLLLAHFAIPLRLLNAESGRLVVAGDHLQLAPILQSDLAPPGGLHEPLVAGSVLDALLRGRDGARCADARSARPDEFPALRVLTDNFRSVEEIGRFVGQLYPEYACRGGWPRLEASGGSKLLSLPGSDVLGPLSCVEAEPAALPTRTRQCEAQLIARIVQDIARCARARTVFVVTPHRSQRQAVRAALRAVDVGHVVAEVDTVERMQGREADAVVFAAVLDEGTVRSEAGFLYSRARINVALSRARALCVVVASPAFLRPRPEVLDAEGARRGYEVLRQFVLACGRNCANVCG